MLMLWLPLLGSNHFGTRMFVHLGMVDFWARCGELGVQDMPVVEKVCSCVVLYVHVHVCVCVSGGGRKKGRIVLYFGRGH